MSQPVLICGFGRVGWRILEHLRAAGVPVHVVSQNDPADDRLQGVTYFPGDCRRPELLERAGVKNARGVVIVTSDDLVNVSTALLVRQLNPDVRIVVRMFNQNLLPRLGAAVKNTVALSVSALTAPLLALTALTGDTLGAFKVDDRPQQVAEIGIDDGSPLAGLPLDDVARRHKLLILAHAPKDGAPRLWSSLSGATVPANGDHLVACGRPEDLAPLLTGEVNDLIGGARWGGWLRRQFRTVARTVGAIDRSVQFTSLGLFLTLFVSTLVFRFGMHTDWADGLYQTVSIVATGGDLHAEKREPWAKVFISGLKIAGAALLAIFTAIFTQYFLRARLGGAFEARRVPDGGHVVVCGLGNVGFRCVEELIRLGHSVAAIETVNDNPFAETVRRLGSAVILGDATVPAVLNLARVGTARAVIAATESELKNLEIGLLVREANPRQRVVVRLTEPSFAAAAREAAGIRHALSVPALAAPAFAAALYGDRVRTIVTVGGRALGIVEVTVQPNDPCLHGRSLTAAGIDYGFLPIGLAGRPAFTLDGLPNNLILKDGDKLTLVAELADLERLVRRDPAPADHRVVVRSFPPDARNSLLAMLRSHGSDAHELPATPFALARGLTRGEATELAARLAGENVETAAEPDQ